MKMLRVELGTYKSGALLFELIPQTLILHHRSLSIYAKLFGTLVPKIWYEYHLLRVCFLAVNLFYLRHAVLVVSDAIEFFFSIM